MTQTTLQFKAEANTLTNLFNGKKQEYALVERLLEDKGNWVKRWRLVRRIKKAVGYDPGNLSARDSPLYPTEFVLKELERIPRRIGGINHE